MSLHDAGAVDYEVTEEGVFYEEASPDEDAEESDPLATESEQSDAVDKQAREEVFGASVDDLLAESHRSRRKRRRRKRRRSIAGASRSKRAQLSNIPPHMHSVMGSATIAFMMHRFDEAEKALQRVIEEVPKAPGPYRTLGLIYEERGDKEKALEMFMMSAELDKNDGELWKRNAKVWEDLGDSSKAIYCLSHAVRISKARDADALKARGMLYMKVGKFKMAAESFIKMSKLEPANMNVARLISHAFRAADDEERSIAPIQEMLRTCEYKVPRTNNPDALVQHEGTLADLMQLLIETRFRQQKYYEASVLLPQLQNRSAITGRPMTFVQRLMLAICQHRLGSETLASPTLLEFMSSPSMVSKHRFFLWEVAEACRDSGDYRKAIRAYTLLSDFDDEKTNAQLFLNRSACFQQLGNRTSARDDLETVLRLEPRNVEASLRIVEFLPTFGQSEKDRKSRKNSRWLGLSQYGSAAEQRALHREERQAALDRLRLANAIYEQGDYKGYVTHVYLPLEAALHLRAFSNSRIVSSDNKVLEHGIEDESDGAVPSVNPSPSSPGAGADESEGSSGEYWTGKHLPPAEKAKLHIAGAMLMRILDNKQYLEVAERLVICFWREGNMALAHPVTRLFESLAHLRIKNNYAMRFRLKLLDLAASFAAGDMSRCYEHVRLMLLDRPTDPDLCYLFSIADQHFSTLQDSYRYRSWRCLNRLVKKNPNSVFLLMITGYCSTRGAISASTYTVGLYLRAFKLVPRHPLICLCVAVQILYLSMSRRVGNRNEMVMHAFAFLDDYRRNRTKGEGGMNRKWLEMEADYNIGRAMHQLGLMDMACDSYTRVLEADGDDEGEKIPFWADLRRDAAYNLVQIYRASGANDLACAVAVEFLTF